jgi:hypothetical protein
VLTLVVAGARIRAFHVLLRHGRPAPPEIEVRARELAGRLALSRCPPLWLVPGAVSPLVWALGGRARLVLPARLLERLGPEGRDALLAHELAHVRRHDHWVRWLELAATSLYWWHPVAWWARARVQQLEEQCCDAWVLWALPAAARAYARALLETVTFLADARPALPPAASGIGYVPVLKRRLHMILREPLTHRLAWPAHLAAVLLGLIVLPVSPARLAAEDPDPAPTAQARDDDRDDAPPATRDVDRRLRALEQKMERVLQALERSREPAEGGRDRSPAGAAPGRGSRRVPATGARGRDRAPEVMEEVERQVKEAMEQVENAMKVLEREQKTLAEAGRSLSPERLESVKRQIDQAVRSAVNPERMRAMQRKIEDAVNRGLKAAGETRDMATEQGEKARAQAEMARKKVEEARARAVEQAERMRERAMEQAERARQRAREQAEKAQARAEEARKRAAERRSRDQAPEADGRRTSEAGDAQTRDLERRMRRLEEKMDRVLQALESSRRSQPSH